MVTWPSAESSAAAAQTSSHHQPAPPFPRLLAYAANELSLHVVLNVNEMCNGVMHPIKHVCTPSHTAAPADASPVRPRPNTCPEGLPNTSLHQNPILLTPLPTRKDTYHKQLV